jgi:hypothetical protein
MSLFYLFQYPKGQSRDNREMFRMQLLKYVRSTVDQEIKKKNQYQSATIPRSGLDFYM